MGFPCKQECFASHVAPNSRYIWCEMSKSVCSSEHMFWIQSFPYLSSCSKKKKTQRTKTSLGVFWGLGGSCCLSFSQQHTWMVLRETLPQLHCQRLPTTTGTLGEPLARHVLRSAGCPLAATLMNRAAFLSTGPSVALDMCAGRERALLSCFSPQNAGSFLTADSVCLRTKMTGFTAGIFFKEWEKYEE